MNAIYEEGGCEEERRHSRLGTFVSISAGSRGVMRRSCRTLRLRGRRAGRAGPALTLSEPALCRARPPFGKCWEPKPGVRVWVSPGLMEFHTERPFPVWIVRNPYFKVRTFGKSSSSSSSKPGHHVWANFSIVGCRLGGEYGVGSFEMAQRQQSGFSVLGNRIHDIYGGVSLIG